MSDINFVIVDPEAIIKQMISDYEANTGETLYPGDEHTMFLYSLGSVITGICGKINDTGRQGLLRYARGEILDAIGELKDVTRLPATKASATQHFNFSVGHLGSMIPAGTKVSPDGVLFFETLAAVSVPVGTNSVDVLVQAVEAGAAYNGFTVGQINILIDTNIAYCSSVSNTTASSGGADIEEDGSSVYPYSGYRARILLGSAAFSTAGPEEAYEFYAKSANPNIGDIDVYSPSASSITITALMNDGTVPTQTVLDQIEEKVNGRNVRPLTDQVIVQGAELVDYTIVFSYKIRNSDVLSAADIQAAVEAATEEYIVWQRKELGQLINPDELRRRVLDAGAYVVTITNPVQAALEHDQAAHLSGTPAITYAGTI